MAERVRKLRVLVIGIGYPDNQLTRFVAREGCEPVFVNAHKAGGSLHFDSSCDAAILCSAQIGHDKHGHVKDSYLKQQKPVFFTPGPWTRIHDAFRRWRDGALGVTKIPEVAPERVASPWLKLAEEAPTLELVDVLPEPEKESEDVDDVKLSAPMTALFQKIDELKAQGAATEKAVLEMMLKVEGPSVVVVKDLIDRAFRLEGQQKELWEKLSRLSDKKRAKALAFLDAFLDD